MIPTTTDDPSTLLGALVALGGAMFAALVTFGVLDPGQAAALGAVLTTALPLVVAWLIRRHAWAPETVAVAVELARREDPDVGPGRPVPPDDVARIRDEMRRLPA